MLNSLRQCFKSSAAPGFPAAAANDSTTPIDFNLPAFEKNLAQAARFSKGSANIGNGKYTASRSSLAPILRDLSTHSQLTQPQIENLRARICAMPALTQEKYSAPLRGLTKKLAAATHLLGGVESVESRNNRAELVRVLQTPAQTGETLTRGETLSIIAYKDAGGYQELNAALRGQTPMSRHNLEYATQISRGLAKLEPYLQVVYRGAGCLPGGAQEAKVGEIYTTGSFLSTASTVDSAFGGKFQIAIEPRKSFFDISGLENPNDATSMNISHFEKEVLALPGTQLEFLGKRDGRFWYREV